MLAGEIYESKHIRLIDVPAPTRAEVGDGQILFQPELTCLCGSDLPYFEIDASDPLYQPSLGHSLHEMIGTVVDTTGERFKPGERLLCIPDDQRGLWQRFWRSESYAHPIAPGLSDEQAVLSQPLSTVVRALRKLDPLFGKTVAVVGQGPMGLLFSAAATALGAQQVIGLDLVDDRLKVSPHMGATATINPTVTDAVEAVADLTGGDMADLVVYVVRHNGQALALCADLLGDSGDLLHFSLPGELMSLRTMATIFRKNARIITSWNPSFDLDIPQAMRWIAHGTIDVAPMITHRYPIEKIQDAFDLFYNRKDGAIKVFVEFPAYDGD